MLTILARLSPQAIAVEPIDVAASGRRQAGNSRIVTGDEIEAMEASARHLADGDPIAHPRRDRRGGQPVRTPVRRVPRRTRPPNQQRLQLPLVIVDEIPIADPAYFLRDPPTAPRTVRRRTCPGYDWKDESVAYP
jgi:hypothetical protein